MAKEPMYNVVLRYTEAVPGYAGVITWTSFEDKSKFDEWYDAKMRARNEVVAKGVSEDEAIRLTKKTPLACYITAAIHESTDPKTGRVNPEVLDMRLTNIATAKVLSRRRQS